jgi:hypothetical protein
MSGTIIRGGRNFSRTNGLADSDAADEKKGEEEIELSDADIDAVSYAHADTTTAANIAAVQAADPGAVVFASSSSFLQFLTSSEDSLPPEAAGLQMFVPTRPPSVDTAFTSGQDLMLSQLKAVHGFDSSLLSSFIFPADGSLASVIISLRDIFNKFVSGRSSSCTNTFQYTILATPDLAALTVVVVVQTDFQNGTEIHPILG